MLPSADQSSFPSPQSKARGGDLSIPEGRMLAQGETGASSSARGSGRLGSSLNEKVGITP